MKLPISPLRKPVQPASTYIIARSGPGMVSITLPLCEASTSKLNSSVVSARRSWRRSVLTLSFDRWTSVSTNAAPVPHQPSRELLRRLQIMIVRLSALSGLAQSAQEVDRPAGRDVADQFPLAGVDHALELRRSRVDLLGRDTLVLQVAFELCNMFRKRTLPLLFRRVDQAGFLAFDLTEDFVQHGLGRRLVDRQRQATFDARDVAVAAPPLLRFRFHLLAGLRIGDEDRFLVEARHFVVLRISTAHHGRFLAGAVAIRHQHDLRTTEQS